MMDIDGDEDYKDGILGDGHGGFDMCTSMSATKGKGKGRGTRSEDRQKRRCAQLKEVKQENVKDVCKCKSNNLRSAH